MDSFSLASLAVGAHHPLCGRGPVPAGDDLIGRLIERVNSLEAEAERLKARAFALDWIEGESPAVVPRCDVWVVMPPGEAVRMFTGDTLAEAVGKAMAAETRGGETDA